MKKGTFGVISKGDKHLSKDMTGYQLGIGNRKHTMNLKKELYQDKINNNLTKEQFLEKLIIFFKGKSSNVASTKFPWFLLVLLELEITYGGSFETRSELLRFLVLDYFKDHWAYEFLKTNGHTADMLMAGKELASLI